MKALKLFIIPMILAGLTALAFPLLFILAPNPNKDQAAVAAFFFAIIFGVCATGYMIPAIISGFRSSPNFVLITILNILGGWTVFGWIGALIWSLIDKKSEPAVVVQQIYYTGTPPPNVPPLIPQTPPTPPPQP